MRLKPEELDPIEMNTDGLIATLSANIASLTAAIGLLREEIHQLTGRVTVLEVKQLKEEGREEGRKEVEKERSVNASGGGTWWSMMIGNPTALICLTVIVCVLALALGGTGILALVEAARKTQP